jgi:hypothetical protein
MGFICLYRFWVRLLKAETILYIFKRFKLLHYTIFYVFQVSSFGLVVDNIFCILWNALAYLHVVFDVKNFIDEFKFSFKWIQERFLQICLAKFELVYVYH